VVKDSGVLLVRVTRVRVQSDAAGVIFYGHQVGPNGEISDLEEDITVRLHQHAAAGVKVCEGQRWSVSGQFSYREFITATGFRRREKTIDVPRGCAELVRPSGRHIRDYISRHSDLPRIGTVTADLLWDKFGQGLYDVLDEGDYQALVDAISPEKAAMLIEVWQRDNLSETIQWLAKHDVDPKVGRRLVQIHGAESRKRVEEDCYRLLSYAARWQEVDALATALGVAPDDPRRQAAACEQVIYAQFTKGHTVVPKKTFAQGIKYLLKPDGSSSSKVVQAAVLHAGSTGRVLFDCVGNAYGIGPTILERQVAQAFAALRNLKEETPVHVGENIAAAERRDGFPWHDAQRKAVAVAAENRVAVITGGAGCGKTTVLKVVCEVLDQQGYDVVQLALAGKAVRRMMDATGRKAQTIASFIKAQDEENIQRWRDSKRALVIDEASMVDVISFAAVARSFTDTCKLIITGDPHQLPPVGPGLVLHALTSGVVPHVELDVGNRFGTEIAKVANSVRDGELPDLAGNSSVRLIEPRTSDDFANIATSLFMLEASDTIVLCGTKSEARAINQQIQQRTTWTNTPVTIWNHQYDTRQDLGFRLNDPVICIRNRWDLGLQNGSIGRIVGIDRIDQDDVTGTIAWDDGEERAFDLKLLADLSLAYALTVHKSQGSQWGRVIVVVNEGPLLDRSFVYTAITRAQKEVTLIGQRSAIESTIKQPKAADRRHVAIERWLGQLCQ